MENFQVSKQYFGHFLVEPSKLSKLLAKVEELIAGEDENTFQWALEVLNGQGKIIYTHSISDVVEDPNQTPAQIVSINARISSEDNTEVITIAWKIPAMGTQNINPSVELALIGFEKIRMQKYFDELDIWLSNMVDKKPDLAERLLFALDRQLPLIVMVFMVVLLGLGQAEWVVKYLSDLRVIDFLVLFLLFEGIRRVIEDSWGKSHFFQRFRSRLATRSVFLWGKDGEIFKGEQEWRKNVRWGVFVGFSVSLTASIIYSFFFES